MKKIVIVIAIALLIFGADISVIAAAQQGNADVLREASLARLQLKATFFTESLNPLAAIEDTRSGQIIMYELGDDVEGLKIARISRGEITLMVSGRQYILSFSDGSVYQPKAAEDKDDVWYNVTRRGNTITTDRATITNAILRARDIMRHLKAGPYAENGKNKGIVINALNEQGVLKEIGINQGDIIRTVNGLTLNSPYQIFNAYRRLKDKDELKVEIIRKGSPLTLTYKVKK